jgi:hypothetical protein
MILHYRQANTTMLIRLMMNTDTSWQRYLFEGKLSKIYPVTLESLVRRRTLVLVHGALNDWNLNPRAWNWNLNSWGAT